MAKKRRKRKKPQPKWWLPHLAAADQEVARGRMLYEAVCEENGNQICFDSLIDSRDISLELCRKLDPETDGEKWLFHAAVFFGLGMLIREQIEYLDANPNQSENDDA